MMGRALFFVLGVLTGGGLVFFYITSNHDVSIVPSAQIPSAPMRPELAAPRIAPPSPGPRTVPAQSTPVARNTASAPAANLLLPVRGIQPSELIDTFNQTRGGTRIHEALDIMAPRGREVVAVDDGKVAKLFNSKQGGLTVYQFDPSERFAYYYAHLDRYAQGVTEGKRLKRGELVGYVGSTGNANPDAPHLHFAILELGPEKRWWEGKPINPYPLLNGRSAVEPEMKNKNEQGQ